MALNQATNDFRIQDIDYLMDHCKGMMKEAMALRNCIESQDYNSSNYSVTPTKRRKLLIWVFEMLDMFTHHCQNPGSCERRCSIKCPKQCNARCSETCKKSRVLSPKTRQLTLLIIDLFLTKETTLDTELQLLSTSAFFVAAKLEESFCITVDDACAIGGNIYSPKEVLDMEMKILRVLNWKLHYPTAVEVARTLIIIFNLPKEVDAEIFFKHVDNYMEFCWLEYELSTFGMVTIALTSLLCSFENTGILGYGEQLVMSVCQYFNLNTEHLRDCFTSVVKKIKEYSTFHEKKPAKSTCNDEVKPKRDDRKGNSEGILLPITDEEKAILECKTETSNNSMDIQESLSTSEDLKSEKMEIIQEYSIDSFHQQCYDALECHSPCNELIIIRQDLKIEESSNGLRGLSYNQSY